MPIRNAQASDLQAIVAIYNDAIPGRMATADTTPLTTAEREPWFAEFDPARRPLWVFTADGSDGVQGWLSLRSFYGRPAYHRTVEVAVYVATTAQRRGIAKSLLQHALARAPGLGVQTLLAFVFGHNVPSVDLFRRAGFVQWGWLPGIAELDGVERDLFILGRRL